MENKWVGYEEGVSGLTIQIQILVATKVGCDLATR